MPILTDSVNVLLWVGFCNSQLVVGKTALPNIYCKTPKGVPLLLMNNILPFIVCIVENLIITSA